MTHRTAHRQVTNAVDRLGKQSDWLDTIDKEYTTDGKHIELAQYYIKRAQEILSYIKQSDYRRRD